MDLALLAKARMAQATFDVVANAATGSLMESAGTSSVTIATTLTKPEGAFKLTFTGFRPQGDRTYLLEARSSATTSTTTSPSGTREAVWGLTGKR
ncbi:hypothetical protein D3C86_1664340 [compost metagenome]